MNKMNIYSYYNNLSSCNITIQDIERCTKHPFHPVIHTCITYLYNEAFFDDGKIDFDGNLTIIDQESNFEVSIIERIN